MKEVAITLPLDVVESLVATGRRFHTGNLKKPDRDALEIAEREVKEVRAALGRSEA